MLNVSRIIHVSRVARPRSSDWHPRHEGRRSSFSKANPRRSWLRNIGHRHRSAGAPTFPPDVTRDEIAVEAGARIHDLAARGDRGSAIETMGVGLASWLRSRCSTVAGALAIGGSAGTSIATAGMRQLPTGVPKLMVSTVASGNTRSYVGISDIAMLYPVADFAGLNRLTRTILANAA